MVISSLRISFGMEKNVKLIDFGLAFKGELSAAACGGTPSYIAPEVLLGLMATKAIDVWGLGCVLFSAYTGEGVFRADKLVILMQDHELRLQRRYPKELKQKKPS